MPGLNMWDPAWGAVPVGRSKQRMRAIGCALTAIAECARRLDTDQQATPVTIQDRAMAAWRAAGSFEAVAPFAPGAGGAVLHRLGPPSGLKIGDRINPDPVRPLKLQQLLLDALNDGDLAIVHVDKDGDETGNHWVTVVGSDVKPGPLTFKFIDPDGGGDGILHGPELVGHHPIKVLTPYKVCGIRVVTQKDPA